MFEQQNGLQSNAGTFLEYFGISSTNMLIILIMMNIAQLWFNKTNKNQQKIILTGQQGPFVEMRPRNYGHMPCT